jgi:hypothetical protein
LTGDPPYYFQISFYVSDPTPILPQSNRDSMKPRSLISTPASILFYSSFVTYLWDQDLVTRLHVTLNSLSLFIQTTRTHRQNPCFVQFFDARLGEEDATGGFGLGFYALDQYAVEKRRKRLDGL